MLEIISVKVEPVDELAICLSVDPDANPDKRDVPAESDEEVLKTFVVPDFEVNFQEEEDPNIWADLRDNVSIDQPTCNIYCQLLSS